MSRVDEKFTDAVKKLAKNLERTKLKVQTKFDEVDISISSQNDKIQAIQMKMSGPQEVDTSVYDASIKELTDKISELENTINILQKDLISIKKAHVELLKQSTVQEETTVQEEEAKPSSLISPEIIEIMQDTIQTTEELPETPPVVDIPSAKPKSSIPVPDKPSSPDLTSIPSARPSMDEVPVEVKAPEPAVEKPDTGIPKPRESPLIPEAPKSKYDQPDEGKPAKIVQPELPGADKPKKTGKSKKKDEYLEVLKKLDSI